VNTSYDVIVVGLGALGSGAAWQLARRGVKVVGIEQFELGHERGASHDTSRILRRSYHTPAYVTLAARAYEDWATLEEDSGAELVTVTGGVDLFPPGAAIPVADYAASMDACGVGYEVLDEAEITRSWPQMRPPAGTTALYQRDTAIVPAAQGTATMQAMARQMGATFIDNSPVVSMRTTPFGVEVRTGKHTFTAAKLIITADAWTNELLAHLGKDLPLTVTQEQVTYFEPSDSAEFGADRFPVWIWMDDPSFYGFPTYGEANVKAAQDCGGPAVSAQTRSFEPNPKRVAILEEFVREMFPRLGAAVRSKTCLYTLTPDRDFVIDSIPGHPAVLVGLGAGHGFKFAPTFGRILADLAVDGRATDDISDFSITRSALTDPDYTPSWLV
jgi:sarcosine oxidase